MDKFKFKKSLGQNFLQDENVLKKIINEVHVSNDDLIIEIGPGHGALTKYLVNLGCDVLAFEIDNEVKPYLEKIKNDNLKIIFQDFMTVNLTDYELNKYKKIWIVANIPYYITTPIIERIIDSNINESCMILMVQNEVADRFSAKNGSNLYGSITVYLDYYYNVSKLFVVPKKAFYPVPKVDSAIIKLERKENIVDLDKKEFFRLVRDSFQFKRKNIRNNLRNYDLVKIEDVLKNYNHSLQSRAEEFSLEEFIDIYNAVKNTRD